ncbi:hypothetical protein BC830DRAFT_1170438 [Chytriomyces sp. MP71]|nr:hypothetical protein BC830DRAFT_1170438 [Chytriomyces sp. MP71]
MLLLLSRAACAAPSRLPSAATRRQCSSTGAAPPPRPARLTLYARKYCGLCDHARQASSASLSARSLPCLTQLSPNRENIESLSDEFTFTLESVDIDAPANKNWKVKYNHEVPVLHINGKPAFMNSVPVEKLAEILDVLSK